MTDPMLIEADGGMAFFPDPQPETPAMLSAKVLEKMVNNPSYQSFTDLGRVMGQIKKPLSEQLADAETQIKAWADRMECGEYCDAQYYISGRRDDHMKNLNGWKAVAGKLKKQIAGDGDAL